MMYVQVQQWKDHLEHPKLEEKRLDSSLQDSERTIPTHTSISGCQPPELGDNEHVS